VKPRSSSLIAALLACFGLAGGGAVLAADAGDSGALSCPDPAIGPVLPPAPDRSGAPVVMYARSLDASKTRTAIAEGNVELYRADQYLATEKILYDPVSEVVTIPGKVRYLDQQVWINGEDASYDFLQESGRFERIDYGLTGSSANGHADHAELTGGHTSLLYGLDYTTCPDDRPDWLLSASRLELRHDEGMGVARNAKLMFKGVPILYTPYFTFPIDDRRKSGFLYPSLSNTNDNGVEIGIPWYWNIAPQQDATIEPRYFTDRGFMLSGEYRFLTRHSSGTLDFDYMPDDRDTDESRYHYRLEAGAWPRNRWRTGLLLERVGDDRYFQDFGSSLHQTSLQFLYSSATVSGVGRYWNVEMLADKFQVIDESVQPENEPYRRLPRVAFWLDRPFGPRGLALALQSEVVYFDRDVGVNGARFDLLPSLYWQRYVSWGFITPSLGYRFTSYDLDRQEAPGDDAPSRGTSIVSLDSGLFFDRRNADGSTQTLEPRLFYLYVPFEEQDDLPRFDTAAYTFGFSQLFNTNRFSGADRQGDANQLSLAVSTRNYDSSSGDVQWSLNLGQIVFLEPLEVTLEETPEQMEDLSPFIAEFNWHPFARIGAHTGLQWDWEQDRLDVGSLGVTYASKQGRRASFDYRFRRDRVDQFDLRVLLPVSEAWRVLTRVNYSFEENDLLEFQAGFEYESCCWALRTVLRRYLKNRDGDFRDGIYLELSLKGLASLGTRTLDLFNY
jgi:LPS-assembly protein